MPQDYTIRLMQSKLRAYKNGYFRALAKKDEEAAEKWKEGCRAIRERIIELKEEAETDSIT
jgi:hypothetical protein